MATFGKTVDYTHNYNINYTLPLNKIPALDWVTATATYGGTYNWQRAPLAQTDFGNTVQNTRTINGQTQLNFTNLYNKLPFFKKVLSDGKNPRVPATNNRTKATGEGGTNTSQPAKKEPSIEERFPKPVPPKPEEEMTEKEKKKWEKVIKRWEKKVERAKKRKDKVHPVTGFAARLVMSLRNVGATYTQNDGTLLPGYDRETRILGFDSGFDAPMGGFIFGKQRYSPTGKDTGFDFARTAAQNGWLVQNENINRQYTNTHVQNITIRAGLEPLKDLTIELTANRTYGNNSTEFFRWNSMTNTYEGQSRVDISQLTYTNVSIGSAFAALGGSDYSSAVFQKLLDNRKEVSSLVGQQNSNSSQLGSGYYSGYNGSQQEVLIGAFLTSYTNRRVNDKNINPIKNLPLPNWSINYNGLSKMEFMKKFVRQFVIKHAYTSTISISGMQTNLNATFDASGNPTAIDINNNYIAERQIQNVTMSERFNPLIGFDATWLIKKQGLITKFEITKDRSSTLSLNNNQVTEMLGTTYVIGTGYRFSQVRLPIKNLKPSDMNIRIDFSWRDNLTVIRKIVENTNQATAGQKVMSIKGSIDYNIGRFLVVQLYYDQVINTPKIATSYPTGNLSTGIKFRYNLAGVQ
jgi:cell surface protein SprA